MHFEQIFSEILNIHPPIKKKLLRANHAPYMVKLQVKTSENLKSYEKQRNFCSKFYKKERKNMKG